MRVTVFGAGAVGSFLAWRFCRSGHSVLLIGRADDVAQIAAGGLRVDGVGEPSAQLRAVTELPTAPPPEFLFLAVKSPAVEAAGASIGGKLAEGVPIVALQNGLGIEALLSAGLRSGGWRSPEHWIVRGTNSYGVTYERPGQIRLAGEGEILLPSGSPPIPTELIDRVAELLGSAGLNVRRAGGFPRELWRKALVNAAINPVTADHGGENGALAQDPLRGQAERLLREAQVAARLEGFEFSDEEADRELWKVVRATAANRSSMLQDLDRGRVTEIEAISGAILAVAARHGIRLAATERALERIHRREPVGGNPPARAG